MITLRDICALAKESAISDFSIAGREGRTLAPSVEEVASAWLQAHIDSGNNRTVVIARINDAYWLLHAATEEGTDRSGRPLASVVFGRIEDHLDADAMAGLLLGAFQKRLPDRQSGPVCEIEAAIPTKCSPRAVNLAVLTLVLGISRYAVVVHPAEAGEVMKKLYSFPMEFVTMQPFRIPSRMPPQIGVVVSEHQMMPVSRVDRLLKELEPFLDRTMDFGGLLRLNGEPSVREFLIRVGLGLPVPAKPKGLSGYELDWLFASPGGRPRALAYASRDQVSRWVQTRALTPGDLPVVRDRLLPEDSRHVAELLKNELNGLELLREWFGPQAQGLELLLPPSAAELWHAADSDVPLPVTFQASQTDIRLLGDVGLLDRLTLDKLARLRKSPIGQEITTWWKKALGVDLPNALVNALCDGVPFDPTGGGPPAREPDATWLAAVELEKLVGIGPACCQHARWRRWWTAAMDAHPAAWHDRPLASVVGPWSKPRALWMQGAMGEREITPEQGLKALGKWRRETPGPDGGTVARLLKAAGVEEDLWIACLLTGSGPPGAYPFPSRHDGIERLVELAVVSSEEVVRAVHRGFPPRLLMKAGISQDAASLLDPEYTYPPLKPVKNWDPSLNVLLSETVKLPTFWKRWEGRIERDLVQWMLGELGDRDGAMAVCRVMDALEQRARLAFEDLVLVGPALPVSALYAQLVFWATASDDVGSQAIRWILSRPQVPPDVRVWLQTELVTVKPQQSPPPMSVSDMLVFLPLLHPTRDVVRPVLASGSIDHMEGELLKKLVEVMRRSSANPLPVPDPETARRRPNWVRTLATLPGWEQWRSAVSADDSEFGE